MILASSLHVGKTECLINLAQNLAGFVRQAVEDGSDLDTVERGALARVLEIGRAAIELFLQGQGDGDLGAHVTTEEGALLCRSAAVVERPLRTIFGEHAFRAFVYSRGSHRKIELRPIDARLN